ncbi:MAG TPA: MBL fold metallo-hydrolase [Xanthobacteraceae bacterium]|nr:MBL fold metallo-hydrolase [Xanthobacteraceae bacterium]
MRHAAFLSFALLAGASALAPAQAQQGIDLVRAGVAAQGGVDALRALKTVAIRAHSQAWEPGQSYRPGGEPRFLGDSTITITADLDRGAARVVWDRAMKYPATETLRYTEVIVPGIGAVTDDKGTRAMSTIRVAATLREAERASPRLLLAALDAPANVAPLPDQTFGDTTLPAVAFTDHGARFVILFDRASHLPKSVRTRDDDNVYGDSDYEVVLADWRDVAGVKVAFARSYRLNGVEVHQVIYDEVTANAPIPPDTFAIEKQFAVASAEAPAAIPYQWVIRRLLLGHFLDSDKVVIPANGDFKVAELAPHVVQVMGGTANNLIVEMKDGLVIFDAPCCAEQSRAVIAAAHEKFPDKPIKYVVLTHHHMDHTGGTRAFVAEGASVIVPDTAQAYFEQNLARAHTVVADAQQKAAKPLHVIGVADAMTLKDDTMELRLQKIANPHVDGMLIGYVATANVVWVTDIWSPGRDATRSAGVVALDEAVKKLGIKDATFAGGHGSNAKQVVLEKILAAN